MQKILFTLSIILCSMSLYGWDASPPSFLKLEESFFNEFYLDQALSLHHVWQSDWDAINRDLKREGRGIHQLIRIISNRTPGYPIDYPFNTKEMAAILQKVLWDLFVKVMYQHNYTVESDLREIFNYVRGQQIDRLTDCFGDPNYFPEA